MYYKQRGVNMCMAGSREVRGMGAATKNTPAPCVHGPPIHPPTRSRPPSHAGQSNASLFFKLVAFVYGPYLLIMVPLLNSRSKAKTVDGVCAFILNPTRDNRDEFVFLGEWQVREST